MDDQQKEVMHNLVKNVETYITLTNKVRELNSITITKLSKDKEDLLHSLKSLLNFDYGAIMQAKALIARLENKP